MKKRLKTWKTRLTKQTFRVKPVICVRKRIKNAKKPRISKP